MLGQNEERAVRRRDIPVEKLAAICNDERTATAIAAQRTSDTGQDEAGGRPVRHHVRGQDPVRQGKSFGR